MLTFCVPFSIFIKYHKILTCKGDFNVFVYVNFEFSQKLELNSKIHFGLKWKERNIPLRILSRKFKKFLISYFSPWIQNYQKNIEKEMNLKERIKTIWSDLYRGMELNHQLFLVFSPKTLKIHPFQFVKNSCILSASLEISMSFLSKDIFEKKRKFNPDLLFNQIVLENEISQNQDGFFHCDIHLSFEKITELMSLYMGSGKGFYHFL
jgi:hypothetical protein